MSASVTPARRAAYEVLRRVFEHDAWADRAFQSAAERHSLDPRDRAQAQRLAYGAVKRRGTADYLVERLSSRPAGDLDRPVTAALRLGVFELCFAAATPDHAAVDQAVELAKSGMRGSAKRAQGAAGFTNAILRRAASEREALLGELDDSTPEGAAVAHSYPEWLARMWWRDLGPEGARPLMVAMNEPAETALRVNTLKADPDRLIEELAREGEGVRRPTPSSSLLAPPGSLVVDGRLGPAVLRRLEAGELVGQSRASAAVSVVADPRPGQRVLDLCAGPGIKTTAIAARLENHGEIVAVERDPGRASALRELCGRLGATCVGVVEADAASAEFGGGYDRVLVDPPCSDLGALGSRPDARWRKSPALIDRLVALQQTILDRGLAELGPGGSLAYSTCTISPREGGERIEAALASDRAAAADLGASFPALADARDSRFLQTRPDRDGTDGFFIARLNRDEG